jgi:CheY-like chemotaxis protein
LSDNGNPATVVILDDDPSHLRIYGWIVEAAGYKPLPTLVRMEGFDLPQEHVDLVLLDYHLAGRMTAPEAAAKIRAAMPSTPILVLSDMLMLPADVESLVDGFVRKGDPGKLVAKLKETLQR